MTVERVLVLGASGMLGHRVCLEANRRGLDIWGSVRGPKIDAAIPPDVIASDRLIDEVDASSMTSVIRALDACQPSAVVNCIGAIKQRPEGQSEASSMEVNARFPHLLADATSARGLRLVHLSTDCVFAGTRGGYREDDPPDATDVYGRSKALGEPTAEGTLVVRTSMVGRELARTTGLLEWFLAAPPPVEGYRRSRFSGLSTPVLARTLLDLATRRDPLEGCFHVVGDPLDKASLLHKLATSLRPDIEVRDVDGPSIDRTLDGDRFAERTGFEAPTWHEMVTELARDTERYERWRTPS